MTQHCLAVLTAAGSGTRLGCEGPKALVPVAGIPMVVRAVQGLARSGVHGIVVTAAQEYIEEFRSLFPGGKVSAHRGAKHVQVPVKVVAGSPLSRQASVALGLEGIEQLGNENKWNLNGDTIVLIHDAARCLTPVTVIKEVIGAVARGHTAVIPGIPVTDTLKKVTALPGADEHRVVAETVERSDLVAVQTPQGFTWTLIREAHEYGSQRSRSETTAATDDAGLVEEMGREVTVVPGHTHSMKITTEIDLLLASLLAEKYMSPN